MDSRYKKLGFEILMPLKAIGDFSEYLVHLLSHLSNDLFEDSATHCKKKFNLFKEQNFLCFFSVF
jgi:hypothetical protein